MAYLIFIDDDFKKVDYNTAAKVYQTLIGEQSTIDEYRKLPEWPEIESYALKTKEVIFDTRTKTHKPWLTRKLGERRVTDN